MKIEKIEKIDDINTLTGLISQILEKLGLQEIQRVSKDILLAKEITPLKTRNLYFLLTLSELNGKVEAIKTSLLDLKETPEYLYIVTSNKRISKYFEGWIQKEINLKSLDCWSRDKIIELIDENIGDYWSHGDSFIKAYEEDFINSLESDKELKKILKLEEKYDRLLNIFIEPKIFIFTEDKETKSTIKKRIPLDGLINNENHILSGEAGTGKSTLLKEIGKRIIEKNKNKKNKNIPVFINSTTLLQHNFKIQEAINTKIQDRFSEFGIDKLFEEYHIILLIDSIDEFEKDNRKKILSELSDIVEKSNVSFILCTRNYDALISDYEICDHDNPFLVNFDLKQVKKYLDGFFRFDLSKSDKLWDILSENNTLEKIPVTPLTISLISILYEDRGYEIPATITDVYDNFSLFLLGRLNVASRLDFLNINIKKRILSSYALEIISSKNRLKKKTLEFVEYIKDFFTKKSITVSEELIPELLKSLTDGTGVLFIDENDFVSFKHDHFMEYYASIEIFDHYRNTHEDFLIDNFNEFNWQNTAIFYAGRTKDMPDFIERLIQKLKSYNVLNDCLLGVSGMGYILQSLWMTDSIVRKEGVKVALDLLIRSDSEVKRLADSKFPFFQKIKSSDIAIMNMAWFYKHFNSIALRDPLNLAFDDIHKDLKKIKNSQFKSDITTSLYQLFCIGSTLNTGRNADYTRLNILFEEDNILKLPLFVLLFDIGLEVLESENRKLLKENYNIRSRTKRYIDGIKFYLETPAEELRFTSLNSIVPIKKFEIFTEGKTDAIIISHAFSVLTNSREPTWKISSCETTMKSESGGANQLAKLLVEFSRKITHEYDLGKTVIAIFDNDSKGCQEFNGLNENFALIDNRIKKHKTLNIYAMKIPIPPDDEFDVYHQDKQIFRFFELEHYFPKDFLNENNMIKETSIPGMFEINDNKSDFAETVIRQYNPVMFRNFATLFREIDKILNQEINYIE